MHVNGAVCPALMLEWRYRIGWEECEWNGVLGRSDAKQRIMEGCEIMTERATGWGTPLQLMNHRFFLQPASWGLYHSHPLLYTDQMKSLHALRAIFAWYQCNCGLWAGTSSHVIAHKIMRVGIIVLWCLPYLYQNIRGISIYRVWIWSSWLTWNWVMEFVCLQVCRAWVMGECWFSIACTKYMWDWKGIWCTNW